MFYSHKIFKFSWYNFFCGQLWIQCFVQITSSVSHYKLTSPGCVLSPVLEEEAEGQERLEGEPTGQLKLHGESSLTGR